MKTLETIQAELREIVSQGNDLAIAVLKKRLRPETEKYQALLVLEAKYHEVSRQLIQDIITGEVATLEFNKCRESLLEFINTLQATDVPELAVTSTDGSGLADVYNGEVLYRIPKKMAVGVEEECIVRLAFDRKLLLHDFQVQVGDVMKDLRIADVMGVELIDPNSDKAFAITTVNDTVQIVEKDLVTEWIFCVTPLKEGQYPLVLKISIIEIVNGIERRRNEVLREKVEILLTINAGELVTDFKKGYTWQVVDTDEQRAAASGGSKSAPPPKVPGAPSPAPQIPSPAPMPQAPSASRAVGFGLIGKIIAGLAVLVIGTVAVLPFIGQKSTTEVAQTKSEQQLKRLRANANRQELEDFVRENPGTPEIAAAMMVLDSLENAAWQTALASNDFEGMQGYLDQYPTGKYANDAASRMDEINRGGDPVAVDSIAVKPGVEEITKDEPVTQPTPNKPKPVSPKKNPPKKKPIATQPTQPPSKAPTPAPKPQPEPTKPEPVDPNKPVPLVSSSRKPVLKKCSNSDKNKEASCTEDKILKYLQSRISYPNAAFEKSIEGKVVVTFVVERDGSITDVKALNDIGGGCAKEAERLVKTLPRFKPGLNGKGDPIRVQYTQPVRFKLK